MENCPGENIVKPLPPSTVKLLGSSQVVTSPATVVKELMENSFDAKATNIQIKLENYGIDSIQITDNGTGVLASDASCMCRRNCTSKIASFNDLDKLESYGFRGEALNSICAVADVTITTKTKHEKLARRYTVSHVGEITSCKTVQSDVGTTVLVESLFKNLPVRKQFLSGGKRKTEELRNVENVVKTLAVINHSVRVVLIHNKCVVWQKHGVHNIVLSLVQMLSTGVAKQLHEIDFEENLASFKLLVPKKDGDVKDTCYGFAGKTMYLFVNSRPVQVKPIEKVVYEVLNSFFQSAIPSGKLPTCLLSIILPPDSIDVNLEPNKTKVLIKNLERVLTALKDELGKYYFGTLESILSSQEHIEAASKRKQDEEPTTLATKCPKLCPETNLSPEKSREAVITEFMEGLERPERCTQSSPDLPTRPLPSVERENSREIKSDLSTEEESFFNGFFQKMSALKNKEKLSQQDVRNFDVPDCSQENRTDSMPIEANKEEGKLEFTSSQWSRGEVFFKGRQLPSNVVIESTAVKQSDDSMNASTTAECTQERSVSSQMGQRNMCGFTKFAREVRSKLIRQTPDITFGKIARELASRWKELKEEEKEMYKEKALQEKEQKKKEKLLIPKTVSNTIDKHVRTSPRKVVPARKKSFPSVITTACSLDKMKSLMSKRVNYYEAPLYEVCALNEDLVVVREKKDVAIYSRRRLNEAVKYRNALIHTTVPTKPVKPRIRLSEKTLGKLLFGVLQSLPISIDVKFEGEQLVTRDLVSDDRLTRNGFIIARTDCDEYFMIELPEDLNLGIEDLKDLLESIRMDETISLKNSRPRKMLNYIEDHVLTVCSQSQSTEKTSYSMDLYKYWSEKIRLKSPECPHARPVRILLYSDD